MDKYEYTIKSDKIKKLVERKDYETAVKIADTIDWERVRNIKMLSTVSVAYEKMSRFEEAKDLLLMAYECAPVGRRFLYKLTELATKQGEFDEAEAYLKEFAATSPQDPSRLLLRYEIAKAKGEPIERLITILEAYQKREFEERWSYELADLYYRVGKNEECVKLCDEIVLWFGVGPYVDKAMELKQRIAPLTPDQIEKRENKEKYLRRLEEVQKEFENKYRVIEEPSKEAIEAVAQAQQELAVAVAEVTAEEAVEEIAEEITEEMAAEVVEEPAEESIEEEIVMPPVSVTKPIIGLSVEQEEERLHQEMKASLAREIEAAALTAALNEAVLRETAATMETLGAVENDHSMEHESTKVAVVRVSMEEKTKQFVREARVINVVLEEARGAIVTAEEVEARLAEESPAVGETPMAEEVPVEEETPVAEEVPVEEETPVAEEVPVEEETPVVEEVPVEEETPVAEEVPVEEETPVVEEVPVVEETPVEEEFSVAEEVPAVNPTADHYVLVACNREDDGVKECVTYIRRMRELLGYQTAQVAKISGEKLATKNMAQTLRKLQGRDLVVVGVAGVPDEMLCQAVDLMSQDAIESFIALVGTEMEIAGLQERIAFFGGCRVLDCNVETSVVESGIIEEAPEESASEQLVEDEQSMLAKMVEEALRASVFVAEEPSEMKEALPAEEVLVMETESMLQAEVSVEGKGTDARLTAKEFYECAIEYADMMDAKVDDMGGLAIYAAAEDYQQEREPLTEELAHDLIDRAIQRAERRTLKSLFSNRYDKEGFLILKEQHFKE